MTKEQTPRKAFVTKKNILLNGGVDNRVTEDIVQRTRFGKPFIGKDTELELRHFKNASKESPTSVDSDCPTGKDLFEYFTQSKRCEEVEVIQKEVKTPVKNPSKEKGIRNFLGVPKKETENDEDDDEEK